MSNTNRKRFLGYLLFGIMSVAAFLGAGDVAVRDGNVKIAPLLCKTQLDVASSIKDMMLSLQTLPPQSMLAIPKGDWDWSVRRYSKKNGTVSLSLTIVSTNHLGSVVDYACLATGKRIDYLGIRERYFEVEEADNRIAIHKETIVRSILCEYYFSEQGAVSFYCSDNPNGFTGLGNDYSGELALFLARHIHSIDMDDKTLDLDAFFHDLDARRAKRK